MNIGTESRHNNRTIILNKAPGSGCTGCIGHSVSEGGDGSCMDLPHCGLAGPDAGVWQYKEPRPGTLLTEDPDHGDPEVMLPADNRSRPTHGGYPEGPAMPLASEGARQAVRGANRAAAAADSAAPGWQQQAFDALSLFAAARKQQGVTNLTSEAVRVYAEARGLPAPPDKRAWGAVMMRGKREGLLVKAGWITAEDPKVHANPVSLWSIQ